MLLLQTGSMRLSYTQTKNGKMTSEAILDPLKGHLYPYPPLCGISNGKKIRQLCCFF